MKNIRRKVMTATLCCLMGVTTLGGGLIFAWEAEALDETGDAEVTEEATEEAPEETVKEPTEPTEPTVEKTDTAQESNNAETATSEAKVQSVIMAPEPAEPKAAARATTTGPCGTEGYTEGTFNGSPACVDAGGNLHICEYNFPDAKFTEVVRSGVNIIPDEVLTQQEVANQGMLTTYNASSLKGIEYFTSLTFLHCDNNQLTSLDLSRNVLLRELICSGNQLTTLDVSNNPELLVLQCQINQLTKLDVSNNPELELFDCHNNKLSDLDVSKNSKLTTLDCRDNQLTELEVETNTILFNFDCSNNQLMGLNTAAVSPTANNQSRHLDAAPSQNLNEYLKTFVLDGSKISDIRGADIDGTTVSNYTNKNDKGEYVVTYNYEYFSGRTMDVTLYLTVTKETKNIAVKDADGNPLVSVSTPAGTFTPVQIGDKKIVKDGDGQYVIARNPDGSYTVTYPIGKGDGVYGNYQKKTPIKPTDPTTPTTPTNPTTPTTPTNPGTGNMGETTTVTSYVVTPQSGVGTGTDNVKKTVTIQDAANKKSATSVQRPDYGQNDGSWSLASMVLALAAIVMAIGMFIRRKNDDEFRTNPSLILTAVIAVVGAALFFILNDVTLTMVLLKPSTTIFAAAVIIQTANMLLGKKGYKYTE